jgi:MFS transporter, MHS family, proline/betaine transporter
MLFSDLRRAQKEAIGLLQIGTFLEYFDLMIYVHMAVVLNELFFPPSDPKTATILTAFAFCSTYFLRPFGALIFGYIGDNFGRRPTVIITTTIMACCCLLMANLPTYAEIGITAAIIVSVLRIMQGMSSMGEVMGAQIYITETTRSPVQYAAVASISLASALGTMAALGVATISTRVGFNWRLAFWFGVVIALVGLVARTKLRETPEYADAKIKMKRVIESTKEAGLEKPAELLLSLKKIPEDKINKETFISFFFLFLIWPFIFYVTYIYFVPILKANCGYSSEDVVLHNFFLSIVQILVIVGNTFLGYKFYPFFLSKISLGLFIILMLIFPFLLFEGDNSSSSHYIFLFQCLLLGANIPQSCGSIMIKNFPIFKRFTAVTFGYAFARALMYIIVSFGLVYLTDWFGFYGVWVIAFPLIFFWIRGVLFYEKLEKKHGDFPQAYPFNLSKRQREEALSVKKGIAV